jgi:NTE family protein
MRHALAAGIGLMGSACAGLPDTTPINHPLSFAPTPVVQDLGVEGDAIALAFSGGGARAASFSYGVLLQLREMKDAGGKPLLDRVSLITAVSGGSITAAYFGQTGAEGLDNFRADALNHDWNSQLHTSWMSPQNWDRLLQGGLNGPDKLSSWLDQHIFDGTRMRDMNAKPQIIINATDLYTGAPFAFAPPWFEAICSDLGSVRIADAVAASMSVPIAFRPVVIEAFPNECPLPLAGWVDRTLVNRGSPMLLKETARSFRFFRDTNRMSYLHLTDGGVADNFGVSSFVTLNAAGAGPFAPLSPRDAVKLRRLTFVIVNAERPVDGDWAREQGGPDGPELIATALSIAVNAPKRAAADAFHGFLKDWRGDLVAWRCGLKPEEAAALGAGPDWKCENVEIVFDIISFGDLGGAKAARLGSAETAVSLPSDLIDDLIAGGRAATAWNDAFIALTK